MKLGITSGSFLPKSTKEAILTISRSRFQEVEVNLQHSELGYGFEKRVNISFYKKINEMVKQVSLNVASIHTSFLLGAQVFSENLRIKILKKSIEIAGLLESKVLVLHPEYIFKTYEKAISFLSMPNERFLIKGFKQLLMNAKNHGIILGIENIRIWHDFPLLNDPDNMLMLINFLENAGVVLDIYHSELANNTQQFIDKLGNFIVNVHISDTSYTKNRMLPREGKIDWKQLMSCLRRINYNGCLIMELSQAFTTYQLLRSKRFIERKMRESSSSI